MAGAITDRNYCTIVVVGNGSYKWEIAQLLVLYKYEVKQTEDFRELGSLLHSARGWISANSMRQLHGRQIKVVFCADTNSDGRDWTPLASIIFKDRCSSIITFTTLKTIELGKQVQKAFNNNAIYVVDGRDGGCNVKNIIDNTFSSTVHCRTPAAEESAWKLGVWSNEKVILFGRTGHGKTTIAHMLTRGTLDNSSKSDIGSNPRGITKDAYVSEGRGWYVVDTPGFGEGSDGTMTKEQARVTISRFIREYCGLYSHIIYVFKYDRIMTSDVPLWDFFKVFFEGAEENFTVVVTNKSEEEISTEDKNILEKMFDGCSSFVYVDFCPVLDKKTDESLEEENRWVRSTSLDRLEKGLAERYLADTVCIYGKYSRESLRTLITEVGLEFDPGNFKETIIALSEACRYAYIGPVTGFMRQIRALCDRPEVHDKFARLP